MIRGNQWIFMLFPVLTFSLCTERKSPQMVPQNPSPMEEHIRPHHRVPDSPLEGIMDTINLNDQIRLTRYIPIHAISVDEVDLIIHFHGGILPAQWAIANRPRPSILIHAYWGGGSSTYAKPINKLGAREFLSAILKAPIKQTGQKKFSRIFLTGWSAGYGAIREILKDQTSIDVVDGILLLDGLHCSYIPDRQVLHAGGGLDTVALDPFVTWMNKSLPGEKSFVITHSSIFPGTFASTTETAEYLLRKAGMQRIPTLQAGPMGMQQVSDVHKGSFRVLAYAGNTAPDHVDHYHAYWALIELLVK